MLSELPKEKQISYLCALVENVDRQIKAIAENQQQIEYRLSTKIDEVRDELKQDIAVLELAVRKISERIAQHDQDIAYLKTALH